MSAPKISPADWATIVTLYSRGEKTVRDLADMFKVTPQAIHAGLRQRGVQKGSAVTDVAAEVADAAGEARKKKVQDAQKKAQDYGRYLDVIVQLTVKKVTDAAKNDGAISIVNADVITLKNAMSIVAKGRQENWAVHKIDEMLQESEELAELNVGEYTEAELDAIREANEASFQESLDDDAFALPDIDDEDDEGGDQAD